MRIAVAEDDLSARKQTIKYFRRFQEDTGILMDITEFSDGKELVKDYHPCYDLIFLDIEMKEMDGLEAARIIRRLDERVMLVFLTNMSGYAIRGYEVKASDYIVKPLSYQLFEMKMKEFLRYLERNKTRSVMIRAGDEMYRVAVEDILYVEVSNHRLIYHTLQNDIQLWGSLRSAEKILNGMGFARCNTCYLVNLRHVSGIIKNQVQVAGTVLQISRPKKKEFLQSVADYVGGL